MINNIKEINFSKPDLSRILGILLDNAIEATLKSKENEIIKEQKDIINEVIKKVIPSKFDCI